MYPYVDVMSKEAYDLVTNNGKDLEIFQSQNIECEFVKRDELVDKLFGMPIVMQAHLLEVFDIIGEFNLQDDTIIADPEVDTLDGYQNVTPLLNESLNIIGIPYEYPFNLFIPENVQVQPKRIEYAYINLPLAFSVAVLLYRKAMLSEDTQSEEIVLLKYNGVENDES